MKRNTDHVETAKATRQATLVNYIEQFRHEGDRYAGRYINFAADKIAKIEGCENNESLRYDVFKAFSKLNENTSLLDMIKLA